MKTKNPHAFWLRWMGVSTLHALIFSTVWVLNPGIFIQWQWAFMPLNLISGIVLAFLQYWAMSPMMRPAAKRWFFASFVGIPISVILHGISWYTLRGNSIFAEAPWLYTVLLLGSLFIPQAIAKSWALAERFKKAWIFGLSFCLPMLIFLGQITITEEYQILIFEMFFWLLRAGALGASLSYLQRYQSKETSSLSESYERLALQTEEALIPDETIALAQQKLS